MITPVVLSGGAGTRLWPVSREGRPKPFMKMADGESLLRKTYKRAAAACGPDGGEIVTVTNRDYYFMSKDEFGLACRDHNHDPVFLLEPFGRNTAPAVALAAHLVASRSGRDTIMLVLPADHLITDQTSFVYAVERAKTLATEGHLVTFGVVPTSPETGFGYIEMGDAVGSGMTVRRFVEKPTREVAQQYLDAGQFLWNSGMFCFSVGAFLDELATHAPELARAAEACWRSMSGDEDAPRHSMQEIPSGGFENLPDISIDYALMERSAKVAVVPAHFGWSDIGSWSAVRDLVQADDQGNRAVGDALFVESLDVFVDSEDRLVACVGVENLMIVDTPDALLVTHPNKAQAVKQVVEQLRARDHEAAKLHRTVTRPWGTYTVLEEGPGFKIKRIEVKPGASLSLQMHHHRSEHWIVVSGMANVVNGDKELLVSKNESTFIPAGHTHRLENPGLMDLVMIEVQSGDYLGEDDIVRFQDKYGRSTECDLTCLPSSPL
jgi:mannose-1-phosphate guanylyltransferase / mannose-6-phosphate isomerase